MNVNINNALTLPLTEQQKLLWVEYQLNKNTDYNTSLVFKIENGLDIDRFEKALSMTINIFPALRSKIVEITPGNPIQYIPDHLSVMNYEYVDLVNMNIDADKSNDKLANDIVRSKEMELFDLSKEVYRLCCVRYEVDCYYFVIVVHHIQSDGHSGGIFANALSVAYNEGEDALKEAYLNHADIDSFIQFQSQLDNKNHQSYFKHLLDGVQLHTDYGNQHTQCPGDNIVLDEIDFEIGKNQLHKIRAFCRKSGATPLLFLKAVFAVLHNKLFDINDLVLDYPVNIRPQGFKHVLGYYVNLCPSRLTLRAGMTFVELLKNVIDQRKNTRLFQDLQQGVLIDYLKNKLVVDRLDSGINVGIGQTVFQVDQLILDGSFVTNIRVHVGNVRKDLMLVFDDQRSIIKGQFRYNGKVFSSEVMDSLPELLKKIIGDVIESPYLPIEKISVLSDANKRRILREYNRTTFDFDRSKTIGQIFDEIVDGNPNAVALVYNDKKLTYQELQGSAVQLAIKLRQSYFKSIGSEMKPNTLIGVCFNRGIDSIIAMLAILKAGGAYVPMDPEVPLGRIEYLIQDADLDIVITHHDLSDDILQYLDESVKVVFVDEESFDEVDHLPDCAYPDSLAYVIYTSGTTGKPKGVMIEHLAVVNHCHAASKQFGFTSEDIFLQFGSIVFDASVFEIFGALLAGSCLVIAPQNVRQDVSQLAQFLDRSQVTLALLPSKVLEAIQYRPLPCLKILIVGGESCTKETMSKWCENRFFCNAYGPTEATVMATAHQFISSDLATNIGVPLGNMRCYVLDSSLNLVPEGVVGELYISGLGLARGYLNKPELTNAVFLQNPFVDAKDKDYARMYRTGDRVRWLSNGELEYMGRRDNQIKVRGHRIELGEIEAALLAIAGVSQACVVLKTDLHGNSIIAYYVLAQEGLLDQSAVASALAKFLPSYMMPKNVVELASMPLTINGKLDTKALPDVELPPAVLPRNDLEERVSLIWQDLLGVGQCCVKTNIFSLGAHSLMLVEASQRLSALRNTSITPADIYQYPTVVEQALLLQDSLSSSDVNDVALLPAQDEYNASFIQRELYDISLSSDQSQLFNIPFYIDLDASITYERLNASLSALIDAHESLRTYFELKDDVLVQKISSRDIELEKTCYQSKEAFISDVDKFVPKFYLDKPFLIKFVFVEIADGENLLVVCVHHIICDGTSMLVLVSDLLSLLKGGSISKPALQYKEYSQYANEQAKQATQLENKDRYWQKIFEDIKPVKWKHLQQVPLVNTHAGDYLVFHVNEDRLSRLNQYAKQHNVTLFVLLMHVFSQVLRRHIQNDNVAIAVPHVLREKEVFKHIIGMFVNLVPIGIDLSDESPNNIRLKSLMADVQSAFSRAWFPHHQCGQSQFNIMFEYMHVDDPEVFKRVNMLPVSSCEFDLSLYITNLHDSLECILSFSTQIFNCSLVKILSDEFNVVIDQMTLDGNFTDD